MFSDGLSGFFRDGGFGMWPTLLFAFPLVALAVLYALRPEKRAVPVLWNLGMLVLGSGVLGTWVGIINTLRYIQREDVPAAERLGILALGAAESLNNLVLALIFVVLTLLVTAVGTYRGSRQA